MTSHVPLKRLIDPQRPITYGIVQAGQNVPGGTPYIRPTDMTATEGVKDASGLQRTSAAIAEAYRRSVIQEGDVVVSIGPSYGKLMVVPPELSGANLTQGTARLAPSRSTLAKFLYWVLQARTATEFWNVDVAGATFRALNLEPLGRTPVPLMPRDEQHRIVRFLDTEVARLDHATILRQKQVGLVERQARMALPVALQSVELTSKTGVAWMPMGRENWRTVPLKYVTTCLDGKRVPLSGEQRSNMQGGFPYHGASRVVDHIDDWLFDDELVLFGEDGAALENEDFDVVQRVSGRCWVNNHAHVLKSGPDILPDYLALYLRSADRWSLITGATRPKVTQESLNNLLVVVPPISDQAHLVDVAKEFRKSRLSLVESLRQSIALLKERRQALITAAISGELDVSTARGVA